MKCKSCKTKIKDKKVDFCPYCGIILSGKDYTDITIILDRSGSMASCKDATMKGFNGFLLEQGQIEGKATMSLYQFNEGYNIVYENLPIKHAHVLNNTNYQPSGSTALLDAVGKAITDKENYFNSIPKNDRPKNVLFVILTDGEENASNEFSKTQIKQLIENKKAKKWQFAFIGAGIDAFSERHAGGMGISKGHTMRVDDTPVGISSAFDYLISSTTSYRGGSSFSLDEDD